ncbi:MAG: histidine kinase dimerization/phospho-acceptor domain-containing protein, partial [Steroidobacteraceae bacterium]
MSLARRLMIAIGALLLALAAGLAVLQITMGSRYYLETTQRLNASLAMYMVGTRPPFRDGRIDERAFRGLASIVMSANPAVEVYALDRTGRILASGVPSKDWQRRTIALGPIRRFLSGHYAVPLLGDDPRSGTRQRIFSVASVGPRDAPDGYLYVILDGRARQSSAALARASYVQTTAVGSIFATAVFLIVIAWLLVRWLTGPLRRLAARVNQAFERGGPRPTPANTTTNELQRLEAAFASLEDRVSTQMAQIGSADRDRRALMAQVSHDLRTPLGVTLGYIESALMRDASLSSAERRELLARAYRQGEALQDLVQDLGTLAALEAPDQPLLLEEVSLSELGHDVAQGLFVLAERFGVTLSMDVTRSDTRVVADLALLQRVLQNLLTNAIKATRTGGRVT